MVFCYRQDTKQVDHAVFKLLSDVILRFTTRTFRHKGLSTFHLLVELFLQSFSFAVSIACPVLRMLLKTIMSYFHTSSPAGELRSKTFSNMQRKTPDKLTMSNAICFLNCFVCNPCTQRHFTASILLICCCLMHMSISSLDIPPTT
jgi:hypothetical protein